MLPEGEWKVAAKAVEAFTSTFVCLPASYGKSFHGCLPRHSTVCSHHSQDSALSPHTKHRTDTAPWSNEAKTDIYIYIYIYICISIIQMYALGCVHFTQMCKINTWFWDTAMYYVCQTPSRFSGTLGTLLLSYWCVKPTISQLNSSCPTTCWFLGQQWTLPFLGNHARIKQYQVRNLQKQGWSKCVKAIQIKVHTLWLLEVPP